MKSIAIKDKQLFYYSYYITEAYGIWVNTYIENEELKIKNVHINEEIFNTVNEAYNYLVNITAEFTKETLLIYTFDLDAVWYAFYNYIDNTLGNKYLDLLKYEGTDRYKIEIRGLAGFVENYEAAKDELNSEATEALVAKKYAQNLFDTMFIPEKKFYLTMYQRNKKLIEKAGKDAQQETFPSWSDYQHIRYDCFRGGSCFIRFPALRKQGTWLHLDRTSAYPAELMLSKYPMGRWHYADEEHWENYINEKYSAFGKFNIKFKTNAKYYYLLNVYELDPVSGEAELWLTDVDVQILMKYLHIIEMSCSYLKICEKNYLPKYYLDFVYDAYSKKVAAKQQSDAFYLAQKKKEVNAHYGNLIINTSTYEEYCKLSRSTRPEWGVWCTAYERKELLSLVERVEYALYGDTDSIFCKYSDTSIYELNEYNATIRNKIKELCNNNKNYNYELLKDLGTFKIEHIINDFMALKQKQYGYITDTGEEIIHCSGYRDGVVKYENLVNRKLPEIMVNFTYISGTSIVVKEIKFIEAKLVLEEAKQKIN